jgi:hypothetical protein
MKSKNTLLGIAAICLLFPLFSLAQSGKNGTVFNQSTIDGIGGAFPGTLVAQGGFGTDMTLINDLDGNGTEDMLVGAPGHQSSSNTNIGRAWVMFMNANGTVDSVSPIGDQLGGLNYPLQPGDAFGYSVAYLGDLDGDSRPEVAVGAPGNRQTTRDTGAVFILSLNTDGSVFKEVRIANGEGGMPFTLGRDESFGTGLAALGDVDQDGVMDISVGSSRYGSTRGAAYVLFMNTDGTVKGGTRISNNEGGLGGVLAPNYRFGEDVAPLGDRDEDGIPDLLVGCWGDPTGASYMGSAFLLYLKPDGTVRRTEKLDGASERLQDSLASFDYFGWAVNTIADLDGDGLREIAVGATRTSIDGRSGAGRLYIIFATRYGKVRDFVTIAPGEGNYQGRASSFESLGEGVCEIFDVNNDGIRDIALGIPGANGGINGDGKVDILQLNGLGESTVSARAVQFPINGNVVIGGSAYLFDRFDKNAEFNGFDTAYTTSIDPDGTFSFKKVLNREYILKMEPDTANASNKDLMPTYYWYSFPNKIPARRYTSATALSVLGDTAMGDLPVTFKPAPVNRIFFASYGRSYPGRKNGGEPLAFAPIMLFDPATDTIVSFAILGKDGIGEINVPDTTRFYDLVLDLPGLPMNSSLADSVRIPTQNGTATIGFIADSVEIKIEFNQALPTSVLPEVEPLFFQVFPNPASGQVRISWEGASQKIAEIRLYDGQGRLLQKDIPREREGFYFDLDAYDAGLYFVSIISRDGKAATQQLIVK